MKNILMEKRAETKINKHGGERKDVRVVFPNRIESERNEE